MKYVKAFIVLALVVSMGMNFTLMKKLDEVEHRVISVTNYQQQMMDRVNSQTNHIENVMNEIKREQSWISSINTDVTIKETKAEITFDWQIKELHENSSVEFHYSFGDDEEYITIPAVEKKNGLFEVAITKEVTAEPEWFIDYTAFSDQEMEVRKKKMEEKKMEQYEQSKINYFVSVSYEDVVKSGAIQMINLGELGRSDYGLIHVMGDMNKSNYHISVMNSVRNDDSSTFLKEVYLLKYKDGKLMEEEQLEAEEINNGHRNRPMHFRMKEVDSFEYTSLAVKVVYSNGKVFENEVY